MATITIQDETTGNKNKRSWQLEFLDETINAQEFIRRRIYEEVLEHNSKNQETYQGLVQPSDSERTLNGFKTKQNHKLNWEAQYAKALDAFSQNGFVMLVNDQQIENLYDNINLKTGTVVTFLKLVPLVGG